MVNDVLLILNTIHYLLHFKSIKTISYGVKQLFHVNTQCTNMWQIEIVLNESS